MLRCSLFLFLITATNAGFEGDKEVVNFHLPGQFAKVKKAAADQNRLILIKGIGFGVDKTGATCATKGKW